MRFDVSRIAWDGMASVHLAPAMEPDPLEGVSWLRGEVMARLLALFAVKMDGRRVGSVCVRIEQPGGGPEAVFVAAGGDGGGVYLYPRLLGVFVDLARAWGCVSARCHAKRRGVGRWLLAAGFEVSETRDGETVYRKGL